MFVTVNNLKTQVEQPYGALLSL